jgi:hypothetical protein
MHMSYQLKVINNEIASVVTIQEDCQYNHIEAEKVIVDEYVTARLFGKVKDVVVKKGAKLFLHGIVSGHIKNQGEIVLFG